MQTDQNFWLALLDRFGIPVVLLGLILWFMLKHLWPFFKEQLADKQTTIAALILRFEKAQADHLLEFTKSRAEFLVALDKRDATTGLLTQAISALRESIENPLPR